MRTILPCSILLMSALSKIGMTDADVKSAVIAGRYKSPLSTSQRRRTRQERIMLRKKYDIDTSQLGCLNPDLLISVDNGNCEQFTKKHLEERSSNVVTTSHRIGDSQVNVMAEIFYKNSEEPHSLTKDFRFMAAVTFMEWAEVVRIVGSNNVDIIDANLATQKRTPSNDQKIVFVEQVI
jgi:hypothetical protein